MSETRKAATRFMIHLCGERFEDAYDLLADDATYRIIGKTPLSGLLEGREAVKAALLPVWGSFKSVPVFKLKEIIVEGERAIGIASDRGVGPSGIDYEQAFHIFLMRVEGGRIKDVVEFIDTVELEVSVFQKALVAT